MGSLAGELAQGGQVDCHHGRHQEENA